MQNFHHDAAQENISVSDKKRLVAMLLCINFGGFGFHRFYVGRTKSGIVQLLTLGGLGFWAISDLVQIIRGKFKDALGREVVVWSAPAKETGKGRYVFLIVLCLLFLAAGSPLAYWAGQALIPSKDPFFPYVLILMFWGPVFLTGAMLVIYGLFGFFYSMFKLAEKT